MDWDLVLNNIDKERINRRRVISVENIKILRKLNSKVKLYFYNYYIFRIKDIKNHGKYKMLFDKTLFKGEIFKRESVYSVVDSKRFKNNINYILLYLNEVEDENGICSFVNMSEFLKGKTLKKVFNELQAIYDFIEYIEQKGFLHGFDISEFYLFHFQNDIPPFWNKFYSRDERVRMIGDIKKYYLFVYDKLSSFEYVEVGNYTSYIRVYIQDKIYEFIESKNINKLEKELFFVIDNYKYVDSVEYAIILLKEAYLYVGEYDKFFEIHERYIKTKMIARLEIEDVINYKPKAKNTEISGVEFISVSQKSGITDLGVKNINSYLLVVERYLQEFQREHGLNFYEYYARKTESDGVFGLLNEYKLSPKRIEVMASQHNQFMNRKKLGLNETRSLFTRYGFHDIRVKIPFERFSGVAIEVINQEMMKLKRTVENLYREERNIPRIGEGWINETQLFYDLKKYFSETEVIHHAHIKWLGKQHLDVYFSEWNIGVEYQGAQHDRPVDFFGGEEQFKKQQANDRKKLRKCKENGCKLFYVYPDYVFEAVVEEINDYLLTNRKVKFDGKKL